MKLTENASLKKAGETENLSEKFGIFLFALIMRSQFTKIPLISSVN
jgi:hypothetical protein